MADLGLTSCKLQPERLTMLIKKIAIASAIVAALSLAACSKPADTTDTTAAPAAASAPDTTAASAPADTSASGAAASGAASGTATSGAAS